MASTVIAFKQTINECTAAALNQRVGVSQLQQPVSEIASSKGIGTLANLLQRNAWGKTGSKKLDKARKDIWNYKNNGKTDVEKTD